MKKALKPAAECTDGELIGRANDAKAQGAEAACTEFWRRLDSNGTADRMNDISDTARRLLEKYYDGLIEREIYRRKFQQMRQELGWTDASALERLLIERIVLCWYQLHRSELLIAQKTKEGMSLDAAAAFQKLMDRDHKRYLASVQSLVILRRLAVPVCQVNISENQVNLVQAAVPISKQLAKSE